MNKLRLKQLITSFIIAISAILSTTFLCSSLVMAKTEEEIILDSVVVGSEHIHEVHTGDYIPYEKLAEYFDILCSCHGGDSSWLPSVSQASYLYDGGASGYQNGNYSERIMPDADITQLTSGNIGMKVLSEEVKYHENPFNYSTYKSWTLGRYKVMEIKKMTPKAAYVTAEMEENNVDYVDIVQDAWWNTDEGSKGTKNGADNDINKESDAFQDYIWTLLGISSNSGLKYRSETFVTKDKDGNKIEKTTDAAFDIKYEPEWITGTKNDVNYDNVTVKYDYDRDCYIIGPFGLDYVNAGGKYGEREEVQFAGITNMEVYTDASSEPLKMGEDWFIEYVAGSVRGADDDYEYPYPDETFYIGLKYQPEATKLANIKVDFRYMNAAGHYTYLQGKLNACSWKVKHTDKMAYKTVDNGDGTTSRVHDHDNCTSTYWAELTSMVEKDSQLLAWGLDGARWYKTTSLERSLLKFGNISVTKVVQNSEGKEISDDAYFTFKVNVSGAANSETEYIKVKAGKTAESKVYYWLTDAAPTYSVEEVVIPEGYTQVSIENATGSLQDFKTVNVKCINKYDTLTGDLIIDKKIDDSTGHGNVLAGKVFKMKVTVSGTFTYNSTEYKADGNPFETIIDVPANGSVTLKDFKWNKNAGNPKYVVEEVIEENPNYELIGIENASGEITPSKVGTAHVVVTNGPHRHQAKIHIIKTLENADKFSKTDIEKMVFKFSIKFADQSVCKDFDVELTASKKDNSYVWEYESDYIYWYDDQDATYTVKELNGDGTRLTEAFINGETKTITDNTYTATLVENAEHDYKFDNQLKNTIDSKSGKLELVKIIEEEAYLKNKDYNFYVTISGAKFEYKGVTYEDDQVIQLTTDNAFPIDNGVYTEGKYVTIHIDSSLQGSWTSDTFTWYGTAPKYNVEEVLLGEDISHTILPSSGSLENAQTVKVTAYNNFTQKYGYVYIYKTLSNQKYINEELIRKINFKFQIEVDGFETIVVTVSPEKINGTWTWLYLSDPYFWDEDQEAPNYKVTEIIEPGDGYIYKLIDVKGPDGCTYIENGIAGKLVESTMTKEEMEDYINKNKAFYDSEVDTAVLESNVMRDFFTKEVLKFLNEVYQPKKGHLEINKQVNSDSIKDVEFEFDVKLRGVFALASDPDRLLTEYPIKGENPNDGVIKASANNPGRTPEFIWYGDAPTYTVVERANDKAKLVSIVNGSGRLSGNPEGSVVTYCTVTNDADVTGGYLRITKLIDHANGVNDKDVFYFDVTIGDTKTTVALKAEETWTSDYIEWDVNEPAPSYSVVETSSGNAKPDGIDNATGTLQPETVVEVTAKNRYDEKHGNFEITKEIIVDEKIMGEVNIPDFNITYTVSSSSKFVVDGNVYGEGRSYTGTQAIHGGSTWTSPTITWWGEEAPVVNVTEDLGTNADDGWKKLGISNNNASLTENETIKIVVTNELPVNTIIDLTMELAGTVWEEFINEANKGETANGVLDQGEVGVNGVEVYIYYAGTNKEATVYADLANTVISQPIITTDGGKWDAPRVKVPSASEGANAYNIVFVYDGQTYEATSFLSELGGNAESYRNMNNADKTAYFDNSMAVDENRSEVNGRVETIFGGKPVDSKMSTLGSVSGNGSTNSVRYNGQIFEGISNKDYTCLKSTLETTDPETGIAYEIFKAKASTEAGGLTFPFKLRDYSGISLTAYDTYYTKLGLTQEYKYKAVYNYALHINLGLTKRNKVDIEAAKDLESAKVLVNGNLTKYTFNGLGGAGTDAYLLKQTKEAQQISYKLGLYKTDYYYRAEMYSKDSDLYDAIVARNNPLSVSDLDLKVYLTYRITLQNTSESYNVRINEIADYYDSTFTLIRDDVKGIVDGNIENILTKGTDFDAIDWRDGEKNIKSSDGNSYNKITTSFDNLMLASGEMKEIRVSYEVNKDTFNGTQDAVILGDKANIVEITSYSSFNKDGSNAGKIDTDSAPDNVNIRSYCADSWFEDDTAKAPILRLELIDENRSIQGKAWEDKADANTALGDGIIDDNEALIGGLTTQLVEKVVVDGTEYDFVWPTNTPLPQLGGYTIEAVTGFDSTIETAIAEERTEAGDVIAEVGTYKFNSVPTGEFTVRALYGNNKLDLVDTFGITDDPVALKRNGESFSGDENILTANYDGDHAGYTPAVYNGQDYKTTMYQVGMSTNLNDRYYDLTNVALSDAKVNDVRDNEVRRLDITANSATITNPNGSVLESANSKAAGHDALYKDFSMEADSAIIALSTEMSDNNRVREVEGTVVIAGTERAQQRTVEYLVKNIDIGLVERPENNLVLDKQIKSIKLTTNDGKVILDAEYSISYELLNPILHPFAINERTIVAKIGNDYLVAKVELDLERSISTDVIQAINKTENKLANEDINGTQNFRFINVDDEILQGSTIDIEYQFTAINASEIDYTTATLRNALVRGEDLNDNTTFTAIKDLANTLAEKNKDVNQTRTYGDIVGAYYYNGDTTGLELVENRVRQLVDYVDIDAVYSQEDNQGANASWITTNEVELSGSGVEANRLVDISVLPEFKLLDDQDRAYITDANKNLILSVDHVKAQDSNTNVDFEKMLKPFNRDDMAASISTIELRISRTVSPSDITNPDAMYNFENLAEIVKYQNTFGRRNGNTIPGNANPHEGTFVVLSDNFERDSSATEVVTFTPPTGIDSGSIMKLQTLLVITAALGVVSVGIIVIKKKVVDK